MIGMDEIHPLTPVIVIVGLFISFSIIKFIVSCFSNNEEMQTLVSCLSIVGIILVCLITETNKTHNEKISKVKYYYNLTDDEINRLKPKDLGKLIDSVYDIETKDIKEKIKDTANYR